MFLFLERGREEAGWSDAGAGGEAADQAQELQEADRGGRGDCRPQPRQVQENTGQTIKHTLGWSDY